jgi:hypothetical protein
MVLLDVLDIFVVSAALLILDVSFTTTGFCLPIIITLLTINKTIIEIAAIFFVENFKLLTTFHQKKQQHNIF